MTIINLRQFCNNKATEINIDGLTLYFSYETLIGIRVPMEGTYRVSNSWGPTTGRHFNELCLKDATCVEPEELDKKVSEYFSTVFIKNTLELLHEKHNA